MDFWRPNYRSEALVDGKYSTQVYIRTLEQCWKAYTENSGIKLNDIDYFCYHIPFTKMAKKAHARLCKLSNTEISNDKLSDILSSSLIYSKIMGNCYTASIYVGLTSLLDNSDKDLSDCRIGLFSYGSGCVGEFFSGIVQPNYQHVLFKDDHYKMLEKRSSLSYQQYEDIFNYSVPTDGGDYTFPLYKTGPFRLKGIKDHKRVYESIMDNQ